ncbi:MAG: AzlD domain-containing protein [Clostridia bacterium]|nr:AzlD domain-containing protein [Clostridia bacterium]
MTISLPIILYILVMAGVTYLIRMTPFVLFRRRITSRFVRSLLYYLPYCVLSAMVIPSVFSSTGSVVTAAAGLVVAVVLAFFHRSLLTVALGASLAAYLAGVAMTLIH